MQNRSLCFVWGMWTAFIKNPCWLKRAGKLKKPLAEMLIENGWNDDAK